MKLDLDHARRPWEARLAREGLAPLEVMPGRSRIEKPEGDADARDAYLAWARSVDLSKVHDRAFVSHDRKRAPTRKVWKLHAEGMTDREIAEKIGCDHRTVTAARARVVALAPPQPLVNPWRRSGRDGAETKLRLVPRWESNMGDEKAKPAAPAWTRYRVIFLASTQTVRVPGGRDRSEFWDVDARLTPMGMDVRVPDKGYADVADADGKITASIRSTPIPGADLIISVPAYKIAQAERVIDGR